MSTVSVRYVGPISPIDIPLARLAGVKTGDTVQVSADIAGRVADPEQKVGDPGLTEAQAKAAAPDHHFLRLHQATSQWWSYDPGEGLLAQADNWQPVAAAKTDTSSKGA